MKYVLVFLLAAMPLIPLNAQDVITKISNATCECLEKNKVAEKSADNLQLELGLCMVEQVGIYEKKLKKAGYNPDAPSFYVSIGEELGRKLAVSCPYFMGIVTTMLQDENSDFKEKVEEKLEEKYGIGSGSTKVEMNFLLPDCKVQSIEYGDFIKISVTDEQGSRKDFYWINAFQGDDRIMQLSSLDELIGKTVNIGYKEEEVYFHKLKSYLGIKKIISFEIAE